MKRTPRIILGVPIDHFDMEETIAYIFHLIGLSQADGQPRLVCTVNTDFIVNTLCWNLHKARHPELLSILRKADLVTADGMPVVWSSRLLGTALKERVTGADMVPRLATEAALRGKSIFLLGGNKGSAARAADLLQQANPGLKIAGCEAPYVHTVGPELVHSFEDDEALIARINASGADILFIGFGNPKQEIWFELNRARLKVPVSIGIGGTFDFITGSIKRAPGWMRTSGLEWLFRFTQDPKRLWKRYFLDFAKFGVLIWPSIMAYQSLRKVFAKERRATVKNRRQAGIQAILRDGKEILIVTLPKIIDTQTLENLEELIAQDVTADLILDMHKVTFLDSQGMAFLVHTIARWEALQHQALLVRMKPLAKILMLLNHLGDFCDTRLVASVDAALAYLAADSHPRAPRIEQGEEHGVSTITVSGDLLNLFATTLDAREIAAGIENRTGIIDLSGCNTIDTSGVSFLLKLKIALFEQGTLCTLIGVNDTIMRMLKIAQVRDFLVNPSSINP